MGQAGQASRIQHGECVILPGVILRGLGVMPENTPFF